MSCNLRKDRVRIEKNVSTTLEEKKKQTRIPQEDEHKKREEGAQQKARERSQGIVCLIDVA